MSGVEIFGYTALSLGILFGSLMANFVIKSDKELREAKRRFLESRRLSDE